MQPLMRPLCKAYAQIRPRDGKTTEGERERDREREADKETDAQATSNGQTQAHRETESNTVAHRALCKPLMRISLSQNLSCCLCAAWFLLSGAVFWLMRAYARPTWFEESLMQCLCALFFDTLFFK